MNRYWMLAGMVLVVLLAGCTEQLEAQDPQERFTELVEQRESSTYHVSYTLEGSLGGAMSQLISDMNIDMYNYNGDRKTVVTGSVLGRQTTQAEFNIEDTAISCSEGTSYSFGSSSTGSEIDCSLGEDGTDLTGQFDEADNFTLNLSGSREVAGRPCQAFTASPTDDADLDLGQAASDGTDVSVQLCVDKEQGYLAYVSVNTTSTSELAGEQTQNLLTLRVTDHDTDVGPEDVEPPVPVVMDVSCDEPQVRIVPLKQLDQADLTFNEEAVDWTPGEPFTEETVALPAEARVDRTNTVTLTTADDEQSDTCYHYDYESRYGDLYGDDNETSS